MIYFLGYIDFRMTPVGLDLDTFKLYFLKFGKYEFDTPISEDKLLKPYLKALPLSCHINLEKLRDAIHTYSEKKVIAFINNANMQTEHRHNLDVIPKLGTIKKQKILETRGEGFENYKDLDERTNFNISFLIVNAIIEELKNNKESIRLLFNDQIQN